MAMAAYIGRFEHHVDLGTRSQRFVLTIDVLDVTAVGLLTFVTIRVLRRVEERAHREGH